MKTVCVFGRKGGTGKSTVSHFIAHGMQQLNYLTFMMQTDVRTNRPPEIVAGRNYYLASLRNEKQTDEKLIDQIISQVSRLQNSVLVIDGGANRRALDLKLLQFADLVLIPTGYSPEDIDVAEADYWELSNALVEMGKEADTYFVLNRWPGNTRKLQTINQKPWVSKFINRADRMNAMFPFFVPDMPSMIEMAYAESPRYTLMIDARARTFASLIAAKVGLTAHIDGGDSNGADEVDPDSEGADEEGSSLSLVVSNQTAAESTDLSAADTPLKRIKAAI